ncbi:signal peptidase [Bacillus coahuilensis m2-6]|uniref:signal peptidase I n=1 Tax=Bacillus coahuilensis TaxID=408580 RepID=UPI0001850BB3|nr:signal peptidase I [Bacillus coahuilensis]KUP09187.1 signal peptidase [Bacillus coahuilensis m2-6]
MKEEVKRESVEWAKAIILGLVIFGFIRFFLFDNYTVQGQSMLPTINDGDKLLVNKLSYTIGEIDRFDVVVFHYNQEEDFVKRVIGLPGDTLYFENDTLHINGEPIDEQYIEGYKDQMSYEKFTGDFSLQDKTGEMEVPAGQLFVMGDNRLGSTDSRHFGFIKENEVVGEVSLRYWPLKKWELNFKD